VPDNSHSSFGFDIASVQRTRVFVAIHQHAQSIAVIDPRHDDSRLPRHLRATLLAQSRKTNPSAWF
jgi:hypothetical protein